METIDAASVFETLGSEARLSILRLMVKYAPDGLFAGDIARMAGIPKNNLSFHLKTIVNSGLAYMFKEGRNIRYRADTGLMLKAIAFLTAECCRGHAPDLRNNQHPNKGESQMGNHDKHSSGQAVRKTVRRGYAAMASGQRSSCCSGKRCGSPDAAKHATAMGYDVESLTGLPDGANMGLSCGNPIALAALKEGQTVLDLGSGGGFDSFLAGGRVGATGRVIGVDMTPEMLDKARGAIDEYRRRTGLDNVEFRLGEIEHLPIRDAGVDVVLSNCVINLSPDKPQVWREVFRVLKPGGKVSISDLALLKPLPEDVREMAEALVGCVAGAATVDDTKTMLEEAGFTSIQLTAITDYVRSMEDCNDPLFMEITEKLPKGEGMADYVVSLSIEARK